MIWALIAIGACGIAFVASRPRAPIAGAGAGDNDARVSTGDALVLDHGRGDELAIGAEVTLVEPGAAAATCSVFAATRSSPAATELATKVFLWIDRRRADELVVLEAIASSDATFSGRGERFVGRFVGSRGVLVFEPEMLVEVRVSRASDAHIALRIAPVDPSSKVAPFDARGATLRVDRCLHLRAGVSSEDRRHP